MPILKNPTAKVRELTFSEHNWHVYKNHERMVRFGDFIYIKNNYPNQPNLCYEAHKYPAGEDLWNAHAAGKTTPRQQQIFADPCPEEEPSNALSHYAHRSLFCHVDLMDCAWRGLAHVAP